MNIIQQIGDYLAGTQAMALYWALAIVGSILFAISAALALFGFGGIDDGADGIDGGADGADSITHHIDSGYLDFRLFSLRSIMAFLTVFGWGGVLWGRAGWLGFFGALACGFVTMLLTALVIYAILRMQQSGTVKHDAFVGKTGIVYVGIPGGRSNPGKITIQAGSSTHELAAVADDPIPTGTEIVVLQKIGERRFLVKPV